MKTVIIPLVLSLSSICGGSDVGSFLKPPAAPSSVAAADRTERSALATPDEVTGKGLVATIKPTVAGLDIFGLDKFGSSRLNVAHLKRTFGTEIDQWFKLGLVADPTAQAFEKKLAQAIKEKYDLGFAEWSVVQHFEETNGAIYVTLDVVEKKDMARRMNFLSTPSIQPSDPKGLIALWQEYQKIALSLLEVGEIQLDSVDCEAFHCPFGHKHPRLQRYEKLFLEGVKRNADKLGDVLVKDSRSENRAAAAYLLAYGKEGRGVVDKLLPGVRDSDDLVRNNVMRVLGDIAQFHSEVMIPIKPLVEALDYPRVSDRSKAINAVYFLALGSSQVRQYLMENALAKLVALLAANQPDQRVTSHAILRKVSGKNYAVSDVQAWLNWSKRVGSLARIVSQQDPK